MKNIKISSVLIFSSLVSLGCSPFGVNSGSPGKASGPTPPVSASCAEPANLAWTVGANTCTAAGGGTILDGDVVVKTDTSDPATGTATYSCAAGVLSGPITSTCVATVVPPPPATCGNAVLTWTNPTLLVDGNPITNLAGNKIYFGKISGVYPTQIIYNNNGVGQIYSYTINNLDVGSTYYFSISAFLATGEESDKTGSVSKAIVGCAVERLSFNW